MRLLGAKEFLKTVKPGTLCVEFWLDNEQECLDLIKDFEEGRDIFNNRYVEFYIFGDNGGSLAFESYDEYDPIIINNIKYDCLWHYDKNIIGDASPTTTLQLVYDSEDEWPETIYPECLHEASIIKVLHKDDIKRIRKWFLKKCGPFDNELNGWALKKCLKDEYYKDNKIINYSERRI